MPQAWGEMQLAPAPATTHTKTRKKKKRRGKGEGLPTDNVHTRQIKHTHAGAAHPSNEAVALSPGAKTSAPSTRPHYPTARAIFPVCSIPPQSPPSKVAAFKVHINNGCMLIKHSHGCFLHPEGEAMPPTTASAHFGRAHGCFGRDACPPHEHHLQMLSLFHSLAKIEACREQKKNPWPRSLRVKGQFRKRHSTEGRAPTAAGRAAGCLASCAEPREDVSHE